MSRAPNISQRRHHRRAKKRQAKTVAGLTAVFSLSLLFFLLLTATGITATAAITLSYLTGNLSSITHLEQLPNQTAASPDPIRLYAWSEAATNGQRQPVLLNTLTPPQPVWTPYEGISPYLVKATIAVEDSRFWSWTPSAGDVLRALSAVAQGNQPDELPSKLIDTIIDEYLLPPPADNDEHAETGRRQAQAWWLAWQLSGRYSKTQIVEWYLNTRTFGRLTRGPEAAAQAYFGKSASDLTLPEAALLVALADGGQMDAESREELPAILDAMVQQKMITLTEVGQATTAPLRLVDSDDLFEEMVVLEMNHVLGQARAQRGGLDVYTSLDLALQREAECVAQSHLEQLAGQVNSNNTSVERFCAAEAFLSLTSPGANDKQAEATVFVLDPTSGQVRALVGDVQAGHEPGMLLAPLVYLTALSQGYNAATMVPDVETTFEQGDAIYRPQNLDGRFHGPLRLREALGSGYTVPAVQVMSRVGPAQVIRTARSLGLTGLDEQLSSAGLALLSGGGGISLADVVFAFATLDNLGTMVGRPPSETGNEAARPLNPVTIWRVSDNAGNVLYDYEPQRRNILAPQLAYLMNDMLAERATGDDGQPAAERPLATIVGGTADGRHAWAIGYVPQLVIGTWIGYGSGGENPEAAGNAAAAPLRALMAWATQAMPSTGWEQPSGLRELEVCDPSGLLPTADCPVVSELFVDGTQPTTQDTMFRPIYVNRENGRLATVATPPHLVERRVYQVFPPEAAAWAVGEGFVIPPTEYDTIITRSAVGNGIAVMTEPTPFAEVSGEITVSGSAAGDDFAFYRLAYFPGLYPAEMLLITADETEPKTNAILGTWDTSGLEEGLYTLLLTAVSEDGTFAETSVQVVVKTLP